MCYHANLSSIALLTFLEVLDFFVCTVGAATIGFLVYLATHHLHITLT